MNQGTQHGTSYSECDGKEMKIHTETQWVQIGTFRIGLLIV